MKIYVSAQAKSIRDIKSSLVNHVDQIEENFVKLLIASPDCTTRNHWKSEIASQIYRIRKTTGNNKIPSAQNIFKWIYTEQLPELTDKRRFQRMVRDICEIENFDYPKSISNLMDTFLNIIEEYYSWLAEELSKDGYVERGKIFQKLNELI